MAETNSPRLGLRRWSADTDTWSRAEFDANNAAREALVAIYAQTTGAVPPPASVPGRLIATAADGSVYYDSGTKLVTVHREAEAVADIVLTGLTYDTLASTGSGSFSPNVFRRGDFVTVVLAVTRNTGATIAGGPLVNIPLRFRPSRPIPMDLYTRPDRNNSSATIATNGQLTADRSFNAGELIYGTVTYYAP